MKLQNKRDDYISENNTTQVVDGENNKNDIILRLSLLSIPGGVLLQSVIGLVIWTTPLKPLFS